MKRAIIASIIAIVCLILIIIITIGHFHRRYYVHTVETVPVATTYHHHDSLGDTVVKSAVSGYVAGKVMSHTMRHNYTPTHTYKTVHVYHHRAR